MNRLQTELHRLYLVGKPSDAQTDADASGFVDDAGRVRALVLELARPADWGALAPLWHGVQDDLALFAPAIAANGIDGYQLWFSLEEPVSATDARLFLDRLRLRYLSGLAAARISLQPAFDTVPALKEASGQWSAFIARDLAAVFADEPWLDTRPSPQAQADVLSRLKSIKPADFRRALDLLVPHEGAVAAQPASAVDRTARSDPLATAPESSLDPKQFLLGVMGDPGLDLHLRIEAARALLPYFEKPRGA